MPQFPNYSMNSYPQFNNQMYQPSYPQMQQYQNPYMDRIMQMQNQQMPQTNQNPITGKIVESIDIVRSTDIPMDGNLYYFPKADGSEIYTKQWMPNGTTQILTFKPVIEDLSNESQKNQIQSDNALMDGIMQRLDELSEKIDKLNKPARAAKKESVSDD